jgi:hypothetical protein
MKILKFLGIGLVAIIVLVLVIAAFLPATYAVTRTAEINSPADSLYKIVSDFRQFEAWSPWAEYEKATITVTGDASTIGHFYQWVGTETGIGSMTISTLDPGKSITEDLAFKEPFESKAKVLYTFEPTASGATKVTWTTSGDSDYPVGRLFGLTMDGMLGKDLEKGLANLKKYSEK